MAKKGAAVKRNYGWKRDTIDHRDILFSVAKPTSIVLPPKVDLRPNCPSVYDQQSLGSCTANAIGAAHEFSQMKQKKVSVFTPSRLFIYYNEREMEGTVDIDSGAQIRDGIKSINKQGVCPEKSWPYIISSFKTKPIKACYDDALNNQAVKYYSVAQNLQELKKCLASGYPIVFGFMVYAGLESPEVAKTGILQIPKKGETMRGGHAVALVGYDDSIARFIVRNSWGVDWGMQGYFTMPYEYVTSPRLSSDFWCLEVVE